MDFPEFELLSFGIYDSRVLHSGRVFSPERTVKFYEIELFPSADDGISYINGVGYTHENGRFICAKPNQKRYSRLHVSCYFLHLLPKNEKARKLLDGIPDTMLQNDLSHYIKIINGMIEHQNDELYLLSGLSKLLQCIIMDSGISSLESGVISNKRVLLAAEKYLKNNYQKAISLNHLASEHNLSPIYFHKLFTSYFHKTPNKYLLDLRISHAKLRLLEEDCSLSDIAFDCGFSSQSYFCYKFKEATSLTPLQYRKSELSKIEI